jgi:poly-gamma-glutamate capsule biosynthesis protein CapA/YwtB (metallophosphatase superfamily)
LTAAALDDDSLARLVRHVMAEDIPADTDLFPPAELARWLHACAKSRLDLLVGGDVMLGGRSKRLLAEHGGDYPFAAVRPLFEHASTVLVNLEGPVARHADRQDRRFSYRAAPWTAEALAGAGVRLVTLANNHLMDCGREGVTETLEVLSHAGVRVIGAGADCVAAHAPAVLEAPGGTVGVLGYYWNRRCAATARLPGGAMDDDASLERDITALRQRVDLLVVTSHWGVPYERVPAEAERSRARRAIDLGADAVIAHHPHVVQPLEIHRGRPIFFSVGNLAFGSGNTKAEGLLVGLRLEPEWLVVEVYALYVKNRDPRVAYQPKVMRGRGAHRLFRKLHGLTEDGGDPVGPDEARVVLRFPRSPRA